LASLGFSVSNESMDVKIGEISFKDYIPLILIFAGITAATFFTGWLTSLTIENFMRLFMGYFFLVFAGFKIFNLQSFVASYRNYDLLAMRSRGYAYLYPFLELTLAVLFLSGFFLYGASWATLILMAVSIPGVAINVFGDKKIPCACLGNIVKLPLSYVTLFEDALMFLMALFMLI
jgi:hypothetical protein